MSDTSSPNPQHKDQSWLYYLTLVAVLVISPTMFIGYVFAAWCLTDDLGLTNSFLWSTGPLSNWMIWLAAALLLTFIASKIHCGYRATKNRALMRFPSPIQSHREILGFAGIQFISQRPLSETVTAPPARGWKSEMAVH